MKNFEQESIIKKKQTLGFQAEVKQLLKLMIHSLYSNKEIFLRELISNASDALDKLRFELVNNKVISTDNTDLEIIITFDKDQRTINISDNGIGMNRNDIITNLGTIAKSGTQEFFSKLSGDQKKNAFLIGQFGVGFYSAFIVAKKITVKSRHVNSSITEGVLWESEGSGNFTIETITKEKRGTDITLYLRSKEEEYLSSWKLKSIIRKYSDHISFPIKMYKETWDEAKKETIISSNEFEVINQANALWARSKSEITDEQYIEFYKHISHDFEKPLIYTHNHVEGRNEYIQLLYIPSRAPYDLWDRNKRNGIKLYVKRVFIMDDAEQLLPTYLRFVKGVIDSNNLPLNVSREILQESRDVKFIRESSAKRILNILKDLSTSSDKEKIIKYANFWKEFGQVIKEGIGEDSNNKERISKLLRFASTNNDSDIQNVSFMEYIKRMKEGQGKIYYITGENYKSVKNSPHLEIFRKKSIEVLLLTDRVDEWMLSFIPKFENKELVSIAKGNLDLGNLENESDKKQQKETETRFQNLIEEMKKILSEKAKDVRVTYRLTDSPACLVVDENEPSGNMIRMLKAAGQETPNSKPILEINPNHALIQRIQLNHDKIHNWSHILFDQALLAENGTLNNPMDFVKRLNEMLLTK